VSEEHEGEERAGAHRPPRLRNLARRIFREIDPDVSGVLDDDEDHTSPDDPEAGDGDDAPRRASGRTERERHRGDPWALLGAVLETGDKAKTEMVRMLAREVRTYLEALELHKDLHHLLTNYSLEVSASFHLKPLADAAPAPTARAELKPLPEGGQAPSSDDEPPSRT